MHSARLCYVTFDCSDLDVSFEFWSAALDATNEPFGEARDETYRRMRLPNSDLRLVLQLVPDVKSSKTPVHVCIESDDVDAETNRLIALGADVISRTDEFNRPFSVLVDPFGNELCVIQPSYKSLLKTKGSEFGE